MRFLTIARSFAVRTLQYLGLWLTSWAAGILAYIGSLALIAGQMVSGGDLYAVVVVSLVAYGLALLAIYLPVLRALRGFLRGVHPPWAFTATAVLLGILPTTMIGFFWGGGARMWLHVEAYYFFAFFAGTGIVLSKGYVRIHRTVGQQYVKTYRPEWVDALRRRFRERLARRQVSPADHAALKSRIRGTRLEFPSSPFLLLGLCLLELPIALGVGYATFVGVYWFGCRNHKCYDLQGLGPAIAGLLAGVVLGITYWIVAVRMGKRLHRRLIWDGVVTLAALIAAIGSSLAITHFAG